MPDALIGPRRRRIRDLKSRAQGGHQPPPQPKGRGGGVRKLNVGPRTPAVAIPEVLLERRGRPPARTELESSSV